jgi:hypothetical protein
MSILTTMSPPQSRVVADPAVPALSLLFEGTLTETMARLCAGAGSAPTDVRVSYLEYSPGASLVLQVSAVVDGRGRSAVIRTGAAVTDAVRTSGSPIPELGGVLHWLPADPALPLVRARAAELYALLPESVTPRSMSHGVVADRPARLLAYVPGRRATLALDPFVLKSYASRPHFEAARAAMALLGDGAELPTPGHVLSLPGHLTTVQRHVGGTPAALSQAVPLAGPAGDLLRRLHASGRRAGVRRDPATQLRDARTAVEVFGAVLPEHRERARRVFSRLVASAPSDLPLVLSHGDFTIDQLLLTDDGGIVVTDLDNACQAPAALDVASFAANLVSGRAGDDERAYAVLAALAGSHGTPPGLAWHFAVALLRRCDRPFRRWKKRWPQKSVNILDMAEEVSTWCD